MNTKTEILVVDDNIDLATILQDTLKGDGYNVMIAHDGKTALAICQENRFDLALIDIKLPDMPGIELINKLAELSPKTEYIIITAHATMETAIEAVKQKNIVAYQTKPLDINQLLYFTKQVIERRQTKEALRESENKLLQAVEGSSIPTFIIDKKHIVTHWNKACENLTGVSASEIVSTKKHWSPFYSEQRPVMADLLVDKLSEKDMSKYYGGKYHKSAFIERAYEAEDFFPNLGEDGKWIFFTAAPLKDHKGNIIGAIETLQDITERKKAEEELSEILQRERFWA
ncbi:MAG: response regulator, partial [Deltaproteobacteria bacterium]|nr:response regulator [Deltaproteobacteria bacterium]